MAASPGNFDHFRAGEISALPGKTANTALDYFRAQETLPVLEPVNSAISSSDSVAATDSATPARSSSTADTSTSVESASVLQITVITSSDSVTSADSQSYPIVTIIQTDPVASLDSLSNIIIVGADDTVIGNDNGIGGFPIWNPFVPFTSLVASLTSVELVTATESTVAKSSVISDTNSGTESSSLSVIISDSDSVTGTDIATVSTSFQVVDSDSVSASDELSLAAAVSETDTSSSGDSQSLTVVISDSDLGTSLDSLSDRSLTEYDSVSSVDSDSIVPYISSSDLSVSQDDALLTTTISNSDSSSSDASQLIEALLIVEDESTSVEIESFSAEIYSTDTISADDYTTDRGIGDSEWVTGTDEEHFPGDVSSNDEISATEMWNIAAVSNADDSSLSEDSETLFAEFANQDSSSSSDSAYVSVTVSDVEYSTTTELTSLAAALVTDDATVASDIDSHSANPSSGDSAQGNESQYLSVALSVLEMASTIDTESVFILTHYIYDSDMSTCTDTETVFVSYRLLSDSDSAQAIDSVVRMRKVIDTLPTETGYMILDNEKTDLLIESSPVLVLA